MLSLTGVVLAATMAMGQADGGLPKEILSELRFMAGQWESDVTDVGKEGSDANAARTDEMQRARTSGQFAGSDQGSQAGCPHGRNIFTEASLGLAASVLIGPCRSNSSQPVCHEVNLQLQSRSVVPHPFRPILTQKPPD
jgi:hypothetical protein